MQRDEQASVRAALGGMHRRRFLALAGGITGAAILAACGGTGTATDTGRPVNAVATAPVATTAASAPAIGSPVPATTAPGSAVAGTPLTDGVPTMVIEAAEYGYRTMASVPGGLMTIQLRNRGREPHYAHLFRLNDGVTSEQYMSAMQQDLKAHNSSTSDALATQVGGPSTAAPGGTVTVIQALRPGQYVIACFVPNDKGIPHAALGMVLPLTVTAPIGQLAAAPVVNGVITLTDTGFDLPGAIPAGKSMYRVTNAGTMPHEFSLLGLTPGKKAADLKGYFSGPPAGPPPVISSAGIAGLDQGQSGIIVLDLPPGAYAALVGDPTKTEVRDLTVV